jgi:hypothetical protein
MDFLDILDLTTSTSENATIDLLVGIEPDFVIPVQRRSNRTTQFLGTQLGESDPVLAPLSTPVRRCLKSQY